MLRKMKWCNSGADSVSQSANIVRSTMEAVKISALHLIQFLVTFQITDTNRATTLEMHPKKVGHRTEPGGLPTELIARIKFCGDNSKSKYTDMNRTPPFEIPI